MGEQHRIRTEQFCLTLLPEEKALLDKGAFEFGLSKTEYIRRLIVFGCIKNAPLLGREETDQIIQLLAQIGNRIAQVDYDVVDLQEWNVLKQELYGVLARLGQIPYMGRGENGDN